MRRPPAWLLVFAALAVGAIAMIAVVAVGAGDAAKRPAAEPQPTKLTLPAGTRIEDLRKVEVVKVIDGDTIDVKIDGKTQRIRYYGVDTPERGDRCFREATDRNERLVGSMVLLLPDARNQDRYQRLLRYIFLPDGTSVDATLVAEGFGHAWRQDGRYKGDIIALEDQARTADRGCLWK